MRALLSGTASSSRPAGVECEGLAFEFQQRLLVGRVEHHLRAIADAAVASDLAEPSRMRMMESEAASVSGRPTASGGIE